LSPWFARVLHPDEQNELANLFQNLLGGDKVIIDKLGRIAEWLTNEAKAVLDLVDENKLDEANLRIHAGRKEVLPLRETVSQTMIRLYQLQTEFVNRT
jgi:hypothetical protein